MSSVEDRSITEFERTTKKNTTTTAQTGDRILYSRDFLLSFAPLDVCWKFPEGFELSILRELNEGQNGILERWTESSMLGLPKSGSNGCRLRSTLFQSSCNADMGRKVNSHSSSLYKDRNAQEAHEPDTGRYRDPAQPSLNTGGGKAEVMGRKLPETEKTGIYQLSKCENPYRPPHSHEVGSTSFEAKTNPGWTTCTRELYSINEGVAQSKQNTKMNDIFNDDKQGIQFSKDVIVASAAPVNHAMPPCQASHGEADMSIRKEQSKKVTEENSSNSEAAQDGEFMYLGSEKVNVSIYRGKFSEERSRKVMKGSSSRPLTESNNFLSIVTERGLSQGPAVMYASETKASGESSGLSMKSLASMQKNLPEVSAEDPEVGQPNNPTADMYLNDPHYHRKSYSCQRGPLNGVVRIDTSKPYEFLIPIGYAFFASVLHENGATWINQSSTNTADVCENKGMRELDEDQADFDDMWSDISAVIRLDQQMELYLADEYTPTSDFGIQFSLPNDNSLKSNDYPPITKELDSLPPDSNNGSGDTDDEIHLPDEDSLITIEDLLRPHFSSLIDASLMADESLNDKFGNEVGKSPGTPVITDLEKRFAIPGQDVPTFPDMTDSVAYQNLRASHATQPSFCASSKVEMPVFQPYLLESQMLLSSDFLDPLATYKQPGLHQCYCTNMRRPARKTAMAKAKEHICPFQYSVSRQPTTLSLPNQHLLLYAAPTDPVKELAFSNRNLDQLRHFLADKLTGISRHNNTEVR